MSTYSPGLATLRRFSTFREISAENLTKINDQLEVLEAAKGTVLVKRGSGDPDLLYLIEGTLELTAEDGARRQISHTDSSAETPIARLRPSRYSVSAGTRVKFLRVDPSLIDESDSMLETTSSLLVDTYELESDEMMMELDGGNRMTVQLYDDLHNDRLLLPSLPDIAIRVGEAVSHDYADAKRVALVVENDPAMTAKLLKAANSALYTTGHPVRTLPDAIVRIGLGKVHQLVMTFALRELFRSPSPILNRRMARLWEHSRQVSAIAHVLAKQCKRLDRELALLGGLLHDIGSVAVLGYARDFPEVAENPKLLDESQARLGAQIGSLILVKWQLPPEIYNVPSNARNWEFTHQGQCDYADLVLVSNLQALRETHPTADLPVTQDLPAHHKLGFAKGDQANCEEVLAQAREEIQETLALLGA